MARKKFLRQETTRHLKIGKKRRKKQKWRAAKGRHSKVREKRKGYPIKVEIGFKKTKQKKFEKIISSFSDLKDIDKKCILILGSRVGKKKRIKIAKKALELKINFKNFNSEKFLEKINKEKENKLKEKK